MYRRFAAMTTEQNYILNATPPPPLPSNSKATRAALNDFNIDESLFKNSPSSLPSDNNTQIKLSLQRRSDALWSSAGLTQQNQNYTQEKVPDHMVLKRQNTLYSTFSTNLTQSCSDHVL